MSRHVLSGHYKKSKTESTISLINIVFLMLIFFLISSTISKTIDKEIKLVETRALQASPPPDALVLDETGHLLYNGKDISLDALPEQLRATELNTTIRIVPDRSVSAHDLIEISKSLRALGFASVLIVTERGLR